jgi:WD40 repeat protein
MGAGSALAISPPGEPPRLIEVPGCVGVTGVVVDGRGIAAVGLRSGEIALYDVVTGDRLNVLLTGHQAKITQLGVVNSGDRPLLVSAAADNTIRVWDLAVHAYPS